MNAGMPDFYDCKKCGMLILTDGNRKKQNAFINDFPDFELVSILVEPKEIETKDQQKKVYQRLQREIRNQSQLREIIKRNASRYTENGVEMVYARIFRDLWMFYLKKKDELVKERGDGDSMKFNQTDIITSKTIQKIVECAYDICWPTLEEVINTFHAVETDRWEGYTKENELIMNNFYYKTYQQIIDICMEEDKGWKEQILEKINSEKDRNIFNGLMLFILNILNNICLKSRYQETMDLYRDFKNDSETRKEITKITKTIIITQLRIWTRTVK